MENGYIWTDVSDYPDAPWSKANAWKQGTNAVPPLKKFNPRCDEIVKKLHGVLQEHDDRLFRKKAGLEYSRRRRRAAPPGAPIVWKFDEVYKRHKNELRHQLERDLRKRREFHSHPAPNFSQKHRMMEQRIKSSSICHVPTVPITPKTLLKSMESNKKLENMRREYELEQQRRPRIPVHSTAYLSREPFMPKIQSTIIESKPFQLCCGQRAELRKQFNARAKAALEKRLMFERQKRAMAEYNEFIALRKLTNFKARPNPCKRIRAFL